MKYILLILFIIPLYICADEEKLFIENKLTAIHAEIGEISAKIAFCREYGPEKKKYFVYGTKVQSLWASASGTLEYEACSYLEKRGHQNYCDTSGNRTMDIMWGEYSKWKVKLTDLSYDIDAGCVSFIPEINNNQIYSNSKDLINFLKKNSTQHISSEEELDSLKDLKI